jgi:NAD(P)-dependent dehydrogenase (short-subunit alcohol dehydrogenase family)
MNSPVVLITGALSGIGKATAEAFARAGHRIAISGRRDDAGQALAGELRALGADADSSASTFAVTAICAISWIAPSRASGVSTSPSTAQERKANPGL